MFVYNLVCQGTLFLIILDQRYRCRTCGRRLRMPVHSGSHGQIMFRPPKTEYICTYGHGTLKVPEVELTGNENADWQPHKGDYWSELVACRQERLASAGSPPISRPPSSSGPWYRVETAP